MPEGPGQRDNSRMPGRGSLVLFAGAVLLGVFWCLLYLPVAARFFGFRSDYTIHIRYAQELLRTHHLPVPHFLFQLLVLGVVKVFGASFEPATLVVLALFSAMTGVLVYSEAAKVLIPGETPTAGLAFRAGLALALGATILLMQPILKPGGSHIYQIGYLWAEPYLNPTYALLKPLALASAVSGATFLRSGGASRTSIAVAAVATAAGALAKPSFVICLLPVVAILGLSRLARREPLDQAALLFGLVVPSLVVLIFEYYIAYSGFSSASTYQNAVVFAPLKVLGSYSGHLAAKLVLSAAFPVSVYVLYWRAAHRDVRFNFAMLLFLFGVAYSYLFAEKEHWRSANFLWSGYVTLFILFVFAATFYVRELRKNPWVGVNAFRHLFCLVLLGCHVHSGILSEIAALREKLG